METVTKTYRAAAIGHTGAGGFGHGLHRAFRGVAGVEMAAVADPAAWVSAREPICSGRGGIKAVEMALAAYTSQITGARVALPVADRRHPLEVWV